MPKKKTSVLFVNSDRKQKKSLQIPTLILFHWKKIIFTLLFLLLASFTIMGFLIYDKTSAYYTLIFTEKLKKANQIRNSIDIEEAKSSFAKIDSSRQRINEFLGKRGLEKWKIEGTGGALNFEVTEIDEVSSTYADQLLKIEDLIRQIPMGKPTQGRITSRYGYRSNPFTGRSVEKHKGIDFKGAIGTPIYATAEGKVIHAARKGGYGNCVMIQHNKELTTLFGHLNKILVKKGDLVHIGDVIGELGNTGRSTGAHLHYEVRKNNQPIDPEGYLDVIK